jgi:hypothetical protein
MDFDGWQFYRTPQAVHAEFGGHGFQTNGISFDDYRKMHLTGRALRPQRRLETPAWAWNDGMVRSLLVHYMERRVGWKKTKVGTEYERLVRAQQALSARRPKLTKTIDHLCREYVTVKAGAFKGNHGSPIHQLALTRLRMLEMKIENLDTQLATDARCAAVVVGIVYQYYRRGLDSASAGAELGLKPPHVRMILWRLNRTWKRMEAMGRTSPL